MVERNLALLDWDGSLRAGFLLRDWVTFLRSRGVLSEQACKPFFETVNAYLRGATQYGTFAHNAPRQYAHAVQGMEAGELDQLALSFVNQDLTDGPIFPFVDIILSQLRRYDVESVIVSGSPQELLEKYADFLGISNVVALRLEIIDGIYTGRVKDNPAIFEGKYATATSLRSERNIVLAIGDTNADAPLFFNSSARIVIGGEVAWPVEEPAFYITPGDFSSDCRDSLIKFLSRNLRPGDKGRSTILPDE
ncbi:haloacid dehalogenase-like hydrolase [Actinomadura sp. 7K534]|uniref:HAD family hydrolase n=1 Tax=Actinomadura sp. 7K534 TaxID=2530366 RepID=UPI00104D769F|nr:haloacid dehalogenase-like hydrolase [Actinomadura sp. 7K534]TDB93624.1 hypothetical protein E1266_19635 [Actinomadura sp. 7K534]